MIVGQGCAIYWWGHVYRVRQTWLLVQLQVADIQKKTDRSWDSYGIVGASILVNLPGLAGYCVLSTSLMLFVINATSSQACTYIKTIPVLQKRYCLECILYWMYVVQQSIKITLKQLLIPWTLKNGSFQNQKCFQNQNCLKIQAN